MGDTNTSVKMEQKDLKKKCSKDEISKLEAMNPDGNSQSLDDESNSSSTDGYSDDNEGDSDSLTPIQMENE